MPHSVKQSSKSPASNIGRPGKPAQTIASSKIGTGAKQGARGAGVKGSNEKIVNLNTR